MPLTSINVGSAANDGTGDTLRAAFIKVNDNSTYLGTTLANQLPGAVAITGGAITGYYDLHAGALWELAKNVSGAQIEKGTPVYLVSRTGTHIDVAPADAANSAKMPAIGVAQDQIAINAEGYIHTMGTVTGVNTNGATVGQTVFVAAGGGFTTTKPSNPNLIQNIGRVTKAANNGEILVLGPGRSNDVPALANKTVFIGNSSGVTEQRQLLTTDIVGYESNAANETDFLNWSRCVYVGNSASAQQASFGYGNSENGTGSNVGGTSSEMFGRNFVSEASIGSTFGWSSGAVFISDHDARHFISTKIVTDLTSMRYWVGLAGTTLGNLSSDTPSQHLAMFRYSAGTDTRWQAVTCAGTGAATTVTNTQILVEAKTYLFGIVYTSSQVKFYINGSLVATHSTNIPASNQQLRLMAGGITTAASARNARVYYANSIHRYFDVAS